MKKQFFLEPNSQEYHFLRGLLKYDLKDFLGSIADFTFAIENSAVENSDYFYRRAMSFHFLGHTQRALKDYNKAILLNPENAEAFYNRGIVKKIIGDEIGCDDDLKEAEALGFTLSTDDSTTGLTKRRTEQY